MHDDDRPLFIKWLLTETSDSIICLYMCRRVWEWEHNNIQTFLQQMLSSIAILRGLSINFPIIPIGNSNDSPSSSKRSSLYCLQHTDYMRYKSMREKIRIRKSFVIWKFSTPNLMAFIMKMSTINNIFVTNWWTE